ncbi:RUN and FYVE domain-containing protein 4 [Eudromia elegans]
MAEDGKLGRIIKDLQKTVVELNRRYREQKLPVTDGSRELHSLCAQLEFLLQFDLKEKRNFFGQRKDYWDFLCQGLARRRQEHEGIRFVTSLDKLKTPVGRARAFLRYCLVHRQLAESLQLCLLDPQSLSEWYYARSPFLDPQRRAEILGSLYELDGVAFHLALRRADLDAAWPMFSETLPRAGPASTGSPETTIDGSDAVGGPVVPAPCCDPIAAHCPSPGRASDTSGDGEPRACPGQAPGSPKQEESPGELRRAQAALRTLVGSLRAEVAALQGRLAREERRHHEQEAGSARRAELQAREAEALRDTNAFLGAALARMGAEAAGLRQRAERAEEAAASRQWDPHGHRQRGAETTAGGGALQDALQALEEAQRWREAAEEALEERAALASRLEASERAGADAQDGARRLAAAQVELAALEEALREALERLREPHGEAGAEAGPSTAASMVTHLVSLATAAREEARQSQRQLQAQQQEVERLQEQLHSARQDGERWAWALQRAQREAVEREAARGEEQARQQELVRDMKGRLLQLLREKDALWQKTEGIDPRVPSVAPHDVGLCARCHKDFRLLSRRYSCRLCQGKVCHACSVDVGKQGRCCLLCYQQRQQQPA